MATDDGGPAFPANYSCVNAEGLIDDARNFGFAEPGLSLRDWFAGMAMQAFVNRTDGSWLEVAQPAYQVADAMLAAREQQEPDDG